MATLRRTISVQRRGRRGEEVPVPILALRWNEAGTHCIAGCGDRCSRLYGVTSGDAISVYSGQHGQAIQDVCIFPGSASFASCAAESFAVIWDVESKVAVRRVAGHHLPIRCVATAQLAPDMLATGSDDKVVNMHDMRSRRVVQKLDGFHDSVYAVAISGYCILAASLDGSLRNFDVREGLVSIDMLDSAIVAMDAMQDRVLLNHAASSLTLIERRDGSIAQRMSGFMNESKRLGCCLCQEGRMAAVATESGEIFLYSAQTGAVVEKIRACREGYSATSVQRCPSDSSCIASAGYDGTLKLWSL